MTAGPVVLFVRPLPGVVGERDRMVHVVPVSAEVMPEVLTAYCGAMFAPGSAEMLPEPSGMPCFLCLVRTPLPGGGELPESGG
jgi:hypothetical protein